MACGVRTDRMKHSNSLAFSRQLVGRMKTCGTLRRFVPSLSFSETLNGSIVVGLVARLLLAIQWFGDVNVSSGLTAGQRQKVTIGFLRLKLTRRLAVRAGDNES